MVQKQSPAQKSKQYSSHRTYLIIYITKFYQTCSISRTARIFILILDVYSEHFYQVFSISFSIIFSLYKHQIMLRLNSWFRLLSILFCSFLVATNGQKYIHFKKNMHCNKLFSLGFFFNHCTVNFYQLYMHIIFNKLSYSTL